MSSRSRRRWSASRISRAFLDEAFDEALGYAALRKAESIGHPIGSPAWLENMEARTGFTLRPGKRGPKPKNLGVK